MSEDNVINLDSVREHLQGGMKCLACKHQWKGVAPVGAVGFECPECHCLRAVWMHPLNVSEGEKLFICLACDGTLFKIQPESAFCVGCGESHKRELFW